MDVYRIYESIGNLTANQASTQQYLERLDSKFDTVFNTINKNLSELTATNLGLNQRVNALAQNFQEHQLESKEYRQWVNSELQNVKNKYTQVGEWQSDKDSKADLFSRTGIGYILAFLSGIFAIVTILVQNGHI